MNKIVIVTKIECEKDTIVKGFTSVDKAKEWIENDIKKLGLTFDGLAAKNENKILRTKDGLVYIEKVADKCLEWEIHPSVEIDE